MSKAPQDRLGGIEAKALASETISRRSLLAGAALTFGVAATSMVSRRAAAQAKMSQADAKYQNQPKGDQSCSACQHFQAPSSCQVVDGTISPQGWCALFVKK